MSMEIHKIVYRLADGREITRTDEVFSHFDCSRSPPVKDFQRTVRVSVQGLESEEADEFLRFCADPLNAKVPKFAPGMIEVSRSVDAEGVNK